MTEAPVTTPRARTLVPYMDVLKSLTGHEEESIDNAFGVDIDALPFGRQLRALVFVILRRDGVKGVEARKRVMDMTVAEIFEHFSDLADPTPGADQDDPTPGAEEDDSAAGHGTIGMGIS